MTWAAAAAAAAAEPLAEEGTDDIHLILPLIRCNPPFLPRQHEEEEEEEGAGRSLPRGLLLRCDIDAHHFFLLIALQGS